METALKDNIDGQHTLQALKARVATTEAQIKPGRSHRRKRAILLMLAGAIISGGICFLTYRAATAFSTLVGAFAGFVVSRVLLLTSHREHSLSIQIRQLENDYSEIATLSQRQQADVRGVDTIDRGAVREYPKGSPSVLHETNRDPTQGENNLMTKQVTVLTDIRIPFGRMVLIILKLAFASIPTVLLILFSLFMIKLMNKLLFVAGLEMLQYR